MRNFEEESKLDSQILNLQMLKLGSPNGLSSEDQITLDSLLAKKETLNSQTLSTNNISSQNPLGNQKLLDKINQKNTNSMVGENSIQYIKCDKLNLLEYMTITQPLNPWKRERPCDSDLKNLLLYIDGELDNEVEKLKDVVKSLTNLSF